MKRLFPVFLLFVIILTACSQENEQASNEQMTDYLIKRPEFPNMPESVGDPKALVEEKNTSAPVNVNGENIIQACQVLSLEDFRQVGMYLYPNPLSGPLTRYYFDGEGK